MLDDIWRKRRGDGDVVQQGAARRRDLGFGFRLLSAERRGRECEGRSMVGW